MERIRQAWRDAGRTEPPHLSSSVWFALGEDAADRLEGYAYDYMKIFGEDVGRWSAERVSCSSPAALQRVVDGARDAGADELFLVPTTADPTELDRARDALGI
jgi:hypothetical protein